MSRKFNKRMYTIREFYTFMYEFLRTVKYELQAKKNGVLEKAFAERISLAITEVNGCELCSYKHTEDALKEGMTQEDINTMLSGSSEGIPENESVAIFFGQHYAEKKGKPTKESWDRMVETYGEEKAVAILGTVRGIMMGNTHGIALGALLSRLKGKKVEKSSLGYELGMVFSVVPFLPLAYVHSLISKMLKKPIIQL